jgi:hypothetical protein
MDFLAALDSGRPEMFKLIDRDMAAGETRLVARAMYDLNEHNRRLRLLCKDLAERLERACNAAEDVSRFAQDEAMNARAAWLAGEDYDEIGEDP